jgi:hypothetical protein
MSVGGCERNAKFVCAVLQVKKNVISRMA